MAKDTGKSKPQTGAKKTKPSGRRVSIRQAPRPWRYRLTDTLLHPHLGPTILVWVAFVVVTGFIVGWARELPLLAPGDVARETRTVRTAFQAVNEVQTQLARETARQRAPRVASPIDGVYDALRASLARLPRVASETADLASIDRPIRDAAQLDDARYRALAAVGADPALAEAWDDRVSVLLDILSRNPMLSREDWERVARQGTSPQIEIVSSGRSVMVPRDQAINASDAASVRTAAARFARNAGFAGASADAVTSVLANWATPTHRHDAALQVERETAAAAQQQPVVFTRAVGQVILTRGDVVSQAQLDLFTEEMEQFKATAPAWRVWVPRFAAFGAVVALAGLAAGMLAVVAPRAASRAPRAAWLAVAMAIGVGVAALLAWIDPRFITLASVAPVLQVAVLVVIVYDRRAAMAVGAVSALLVSIALRLPAGDTMMLLVGVAVVAWRLDEIRDRRAIVGTSVMAAGALAAGVLAVRLLTLPMVPDTLTQSLRDALLAAFAAFLMGGTTLFVLPAIERAFDVTTGMTLIELRDPKNPLLRELQQRAPGTYNHSLNVASIAEQAADAIGANSLLTYVGGLYHDIGKMNKPEYFVENQSGGPNKHDKLSPAMSLLVIVGHVKDGVEIAREFGLPRVLIHFIEGHHGTTLVEYFYRRAMQRTAETDPEADDDRLPDELDYRYPGPKPQTREVAILMLTDAVESATRTLAEPTPSRIDTLVRELANKRLMDGQFDQCDLTFRDLQLVVESISKAVAAIYHGRISYPGSEPKTDPALKKPDPGGEPTQEKRA